MSFSFHRLFPCLLALGLGYAGSNDVRCQTLDFSTLAGNAGYGSADGPTNQARFDFPEGVAVDGFGNVYVADTQNSTIRKIDPSGTVSTLAGAAGSNGSSNGPGSSARFARPQGVAADGLGNVYVADTANDTIRKITPVGIVTTLAGSPGVTGSSNGVNGAALFKLPGAITVDATGVLYVADTYNSTIRMLTPSGTNWVVTILAGSPGVNAFLDGTNTNAFFYQPSGITVDTNRNLYVADAGNSAIRKISPVGTNWVTTTLATVTLPASIAVDGMGNLYVAVSADNTIRKLTPSGANWTVSLLAGSAGVAGSADGTLSARFNYPSGISSTANGLLYVADSLNNTIRQVTSAGMVSTFAGLAGGPGSSDGSQSGARFDGPLGLALDTASNVYVADSQNNTIRLITPAGAVTTLAGAAVNLPGSNDGDGTNASFSNPASVVVDGQSNIYVADLDNNEIRKISPVGTNWAVATLAGRAGPIFFGQITNVVGDFTNASTALSANPTFTNYSGIVTNLTINSTNLIIVVTNVPLFTNIFNGSTNVVSLSTNTFTLPLAHPRIDGTGTNALFYHPSGIALDALGNLYVADGSTNGVRLVTPGGSVTTLAWSLGSYMVGSNMLSYQSSSVALDGAGDIFVADAANAAIREMPAGGSVTTIAGAPGLSGVSDGTNSAARFVSPVCLALDAHTNLYVTDALSHTIRKVSPAGTNWVVSTVGGLANTPGSQDGLGNNARFDNPGGAAVDASGNVYVADTGNNTIRLGLPTFVNVSLQLTLLTNQIVVSWPSSAAGFMLQSSTNLSVPGGWIPVTNSPVASGASYVITNNISAPATFFRLYHN